MVAEKLSLTKKDVGTVLNEVINTITEIVSNGDKISLVGFGSFEPRFRAAREGHSLQDPTQKIQIPAKTLPVFKAGKVFKESVNNCSVVSE